MKAFTMDMDDPRSRQRMLGTVEDREAWNRMTQRQRRECWRSAARPSEFIKRAETQTTA